MARACDRLGLNLKGVFAHAGHSYAGASAVAGASPRRSKLPRDDGGGATPGRSPRRDGERRSTPTALLSAVEGVTEERPGTFVFGDRQQVSSVRNRPTMSLCLSRPPSCR